jgi:hypothetical protein
LQAQARSFGPHLCTSCWSWCREPVFDAGNLATRGPDRRVNHYPFSVRGDTALCSPNGKVHERAVHCRYCDGPIRANVQPSRQDRRVTHRVRNHLPRLPVIPTPGYAPIGADDEYPRAGARYGCDRGP